MKKIIFILAFSYGICTPLISFAICANASYQCFVPNGNFVGNTTAVNMWDGGWATFGFCIPSQVSLQAGCQYVAQVCNTEYAGCNNSCKVGAGSTWNASSCAGIPIGKSAPKH